MEKKEVWGLADMFCCVSNFSCNGCVTVIRTADCCDIYIVHCCDNVILGLSEKAKVGLYDLKRTST